MCTLRCYEPPSRPAQMSLSSFQAILEQFPQVRDVTLQGLGEPLLCKDIFSMVRLAKQRGAKVGFNTNGMLLDSDASHEAIESGVDWLCVSLDAANPRLLSRIRAGANSNRISMNLNTLVETKARLGSTRPELTITMVLMRSTIRELPGVVGLASRLGVPNVSVQVLSHTLEGPDLPERYRPVRDFVAGELLSPGNSRELEEAYAEAGVIAGEKRLNLILPALRDHAAAEPGHRPPLCRWPWESIYITYDGAVMPCCMLSTPDRANFGNVLEKGGSAIWNGPGYASFRLALASTSPPAACQGCAVLRGEF
ncbi:MAG: radical SAM protein [Chloroflexi bacterium]|nr:radical SAM protein [Chloroflexota bacterium]